MQPYGLLGYPRFYFGFDAQTTNGLHSGTYFQIRDNNTNAAGSGTAGSPGASSDSTANTLFFRDEYGYIGTAQLGILRGGVATPRRFCSAGYKRLTRRTREATKGHRVWVLLFATQPSFRRT